MVEHTGLKENSTKIMERDETLIISYRGCLFLLFFDSKKIKSHLKLLFAFNPWLLNSFDLHSHGSEAMIEEKMHTKAAADMPIGRDTLKLLLMCL